MKEINYNGLYICDYEGEGETIVFVHAFPLNSKMWKPQIECLNEKYRIITYDVRGLGKSKTGDNQFTMEHYTNDLLDIIEYLNSGKVYVCGLSMGGYIILRSYMKKPELFKGLILADTKAERDDDNGIINRANIILNIKNGKRNEFISGFLPKLIAKENYEKREIKTIIENIINKNSDEGICGAQLALATRINSIDYLNSFKVPTLIMVGERDELTPVTCSEKMNSKMKNSIIKIIPDAGHLSNLESPDLFNSHIIEFIGDLH